MPAVASKARLEPLITTQAVATREQAASEAGPWLQGQWAQGAQKLAVPVLGSVPP